MNKFVFGCGFACGVLFLATFAASAQQLPVYTVAGYAGHGAADGIGAGVQFSSPQGVAFDNAGNAYVADTANSTIRKISPGGGVITLAGLAGVSGSTDGTGSGALFNQPAGVAVDTAGNVYVADSANDTIRKVTPAGVVSTLAGLAGVSGSANGTGTNAQFYEPQGVAVDGSGNVYVADYGNHTIRKVTPGGAVSTFAGYPGNFGSTNGTGTNAMFYQPEGVAVDGSGNVYVADTANATIRKITPGGVVSTLAGLAGSLGSANGTGTNAQFYSPQGVTVDGAGNVYVADTFNNTIRLVTPSGVVSTLAGLAGVSGSVDGSSGVARFSGPAGVAAQGTNTVTLYVADTGNGTIRQVSVSSGLVTTVAGTPSSGSGDGVGGTARMSEPAALAVDGQGNVYVADTANSTVRELSTAGVVSTLAGTAGVFGSADQTGASAQFDGPQGLAVSGSTIYVADTGNGTIRTVTAGGVVSTLAGTAGSFGSLDGTGGSAQFEGPQGLAVDGSGNVYVADTLNDTIRLVTPGGAVSTLAGLAGNRGGADGTNGNALFNWPMGIAVGSLGHVYVSDTFNHTIRELNIVGTNWVVSTVAGLAGVWGGVDGTNSGARFFEPQGLVVDGVGNLYVMDGGNNTVRKVSPVGTNWVVSTVAGAADLSGSIDGLGTNALFNGPSGVALDGSGNFYIADANNNAIRANLTLAASLQFSVSVNQLTIAWPSSASGYTLETSGSLLPGATWTSVTSGITTSGTNYVFSSAMAAPVAFYRLEK